MEKNTGLHIVANAQTLACCIDHVQILHQSPVELCLVVDVELLQFAPRCEVLPVRLVILQSGCPTDEARRKLPSIWFSTVIFLVRLTDLLFLFALTGFFVLLVWGLLRPSSFLLCVAFFSAPRTGILRCAGFRRLGCPGGRRRCPALRRLRNLNCLWRWSTRFGGKIGQQLQVYPPKQEDGRTS